MSNITTIYDLFVTRLGVIYPSHSKLTNPHKIEENNDMLLKLGYGLRMGPGLNTKRHLACKASIEREITIVFTRKHFALEQTLTPKQTVEKALLEDQFLLIKDVETYPDLENTVIAKIEYVSDRGIEFIYGDKDNFIQLETVFNFEYFEFL